jgi:hypothetical protein
MLPVGFSDSSFTSTSAQFGGTTLRSRTIDVFPIASRMSMVRPISNVPTALVNSPSYERLR